MADFKLATPETAGVTQSHIAATHRVCKQKNTFLFLRPSTVPTMRLIDAGFATKSMDIHDKSSDWGLTSGLVPCDPAFSKTPAGNTPKADPHFHGHGKAVPVQLNLAANFTRLSGQGHFEHMQAIGSPSGLSDYDCFTCPSKRADVNFAMAKTDKGEVKKGDVFWYAVNTRRDSVSGETKAGPPPMGLGGGGLKLVKLYVWAYGGVPVTGDYDMWMVAPHISVAEGTGISSNKDAHGRSAASAFTSDLIKDLNLACNRIERPVYNHGAEAQNVSFTQRMDRYLALFCPGDQLPIMVPRLVVGAVLHDLLLRGYLTVRNPKWINGVTFMNEDMGDAAGEFPDDPEVQKGKAAHLKLQVSAYKGARSRALGRQGNADWKQRFNDLRHLRIIAKASEMDDVTDLIMLPKTAFPKWGPGGFADTQQEARRLSRESEANFGRTGFIQEDGHVSPVDESRRSIQPGRVSQLRSVFEGKK